MADKVKTYWDIATALAWLCWRSEDICKAVAEQKGEEFLDVAVAAAVKDHERSVREVLTIAAAKKELSTALKADKLRGRGVKNSGNGDFEEIQVHEWAALIFCDNPFRAEPIYSQGGYSISWISILFPIQDIRRLWPSTPKSRHVGSPPKYPWAVFYEEVNVLLRNHGLPRPDTPEWRQATLEKLMDEWCEEKWSDRTGPSESTIRLHVKDAMGAFEKDIKRKADK